jgi:hypothetical protein
MTDEGEANFHATIGCGSGQAACGTIYLSGGWLYLELNAPPPGLGGRFRYFFEIQYQENAEAVQSTNSVTAINETLMRWLPGSSYTVTVQLASTLYGNLGTPVSATIGSPRFKWATPADPPPTCPPTAGTWTWTGGWENSNGVTRDLPVCRGHYNGGIHPGKLLTDGCHFGWGGAEIILGDQNYYDTLIVEKNSGQWINASASAWAVALVAGEEADGTDLYTCMGWFNNGYHPGKVVGGACDVAWGGGENWLPYPCYQVYQY